MSTFNRDLINEFSTLYSTSRTDLTSRIEALKNNESKSKDAIDQLALDIAKLRKELVNATPILPAYDQRQYELQVKSLEQSLEQLRIAFAPKPKFAFKRKAGSAPTSGSPSPVPTTTATPTATAPPPIPAISGRALADHSRTFLSSSHVPANSSGAGSELTITNINQCIIDLVQGSSQQAITALHVKNVQNSVLILPTMSGSAILHDVKNTVLVIGCHQFRMHSSSNVDVYLSIPSNPIIEHCSGIRFTSYPIQFNISPSDINQQQSPSKHLSVQDFSHIRATPSPNWKALPEEGRIKDDAWSASSPSSGEDVETVLQRLLPPA